MDASDQYAPLRLKNQLCYPLYLCSKEIIRRYTPILNRLNLTYTQYIVMMYFWEEGQSSEKRLSRALRLDPGTLTPLLRKLENKGYITRTRSASDGRSLVLALTDAGLRLRDAALPVPAEMGACIGLDAGDAAQLCHLITKILNRLKKENENELPGDHEGNL